MICSGRFPDSCRIYTGIEPTMIDVHVGVVKKRGERIVGSRRRSPLASVLEVMVSLVAGVPM
jgi:hypothetical protein